MLRQTTFNLNQFLNPDKWRDDLLKRMAVSDRIALQEAVHFDAKAFVKDPKVAQQVGIWGAIQTREGDNDGRANTAVLYRVNRGRPSKTALVPLGRANGPHPDQHTRERYLCAGLFPDGWFGSVHGFPGRDDFANPRLIRCVGAWVHQQHGEHVTLGFDKNQIRPALLERATELKWHGGRKDPTGGLLTSVPLRRCREFSKGFSDHLGFTANIRPQRHRMTLLQQVRALLDKAIRRNKGKHAAVVARAKAAKAALGTKTTTNAAVPTVPKGFMPGAVIKNIAPGTSDPAIIPVGVIQHIAVSNSPSLFPLFSNDGGIESHFYIRKDGTIEQYRSIYFEADAQFAGNSFGSPRKGFVSVEHEGGVGADLNVPMPQAQLDAFHKVVRWVHDETGFPLRVCPAWNEGGVGYHSLFDQWNTNHHSCPGAARIKQFHDVTVPWLKAGAPV